MSAAVDLTPGAYMRYFCWLFLFFSPLASGSARAETLPWAAPIDAAAAGVQQFEAYEAAVDACEAQLEAARAACADDGGLFQHDRRLNNHLDDNRRFNNRSLNNRLWRDDLLVDVLVDDGRPRRRPPQLGRLGGEPSQDAGVSGAERARDLGEGLGAGPLDGRLAQLAHGRGEAFDEFRHRVFAIGADQFGKGGKQARLRQTVAIHAIVARLGPGFVEIAERSLLLFVVGQRIAAGGK